MWLEVNKRGLFDWMDDFIIEVVAEQRSKSVDEELLEYNDWVYNLTDMVYPCRSCGDVSDIYCMPEEFDPDMHYCGKDQYCIP